METRRGRAERLLLSRRDVLRLAGPACLGLALSACRGPAVPKATVTAMSTPVPTAAGTDSAPAASLTPEPAGTPLPSDTPAATDLHARPQGKTVVGAIRWDAWFGDLSDVGLAVERTLSPQHWHYRLPFYARAISDTKVEVRANTQEIMDREIAYAHAAGLDYWSFVIYPLDDPLSLGLKLYLNSAHRAEINFCLNLQGAWMGNPESWPAQVERYVGHFREPTYQKVAGGRPLVYIFVPGELRKENHFGSIAGAKQALDRLRAATVAAGLPTPYIVLQDWSYSTAGIYCKQFGADAVSAYAASAGEKHAPYANLAAHTEQWWDQFAGTGRPVVPLVTSGWDMRPRVETPVPWVQGGSMDEYYEPPTPAELAAHLQAGLNWIKDHPQSAEPNAILIYAWNEIDEGGWLVPTLAEGSARLDALRPVLAQRSAL